MGNIVQIKQGNQFILQNMLEKKEVLNEDVYKVLQANSFEHVVPFQFQNQKGKRAIAMDLTDTYSFLVRLQHPIDSRELVIMIKGLIDSIKFLSMNKIPPNFVDLDLDYIFMRKDGKVLLTTWIIEGLAPKTTLNLLFKQIGELAKPNANARKDRNFIDAYLELFDTDFSLEKLDSFITENYNMLKQPVAESVQTTQYNQSTSYTEKPKQPVKEEVRPVTNTTSAWDDEDEDDVMLPASQQTTLLTADGEDEEDFGATTILSDMAQVERYLVNAKGGRFDIKDGENMVGKANADVTITGNQAISRQHAKITVFDGEVTLEDLNSSNGTKLNGKKLERGDSLVIVSGDVVTFANEDFTYEEE